MRVCPTQRVGSTQFKKDSRYLYIIVCQNTKKTLPMRICCNSLIGICFIVCYYLHYNSGVFCLTGKAEWAKGIHSEQFQPTDQCRLAETHTNQQLRENRGDKRNLTEDTAFYQGGVGVIIDPVLSRSPDRQEYL